MPLSPSIRIRDEGTDQGKVKIVDFVGSTLSASVSGSVATVTSSAGSGDVTGDDTSTTAQNIVAYNSTGGKNITELTGTQGDVLYHNGTIWAKLAAGTSGNFLKTNGAGANPAWAAASASATLDTIAAAAADQAGIANGDWNIRWNWAKVTNSEVAFEFGESSAATNGTSTSGVPNQVLLKLSTLAASTMSPLSVYSRANHVFSVAPSTTQVLLGDGTTANPILARASAVGTGISFNTFAGNQTVTIAMANVRFDIQSGAIAGGGVRLSPSGGGIRIVDSGAVNIIDIGDATANVLLFQAAAAAASRVQVSVNAAESVRWIIDGSNNNIMQASNAQATTAGYALNFRKSRGTVASPTVITTGDDLGTINFYGYVGATNTYQLAAYILGDSTGTISDSATGIGGIIGIYAATGAEPVEIANFQAATTTGGGWLTMQEADADPGTGVLASLDGVSIYNKNNKFVIAYNNAATITYISIPLDGSTTAWTHSTTAP